MLVGLGLGPVGASAVDDGPITLVERTEPGQRTRVLASLEAEGRYLPGEGTDEEPVSPLELTVSSRLESVEQVVEVTPEGLPKRVWRKVDRGEVEIGGQEPIRPQTIRLRPEVSSLIITRTDSGAVEVASPGGALSRAELDLVRMPADPMAVCTIVPEGEVAVGDRWDISDVLARSISGYDVLASNAVSATLREVDEDSAAISLEGAIEGAVLGGRGTMTVEGSARFDRKIGRLVEFEVRRVEKREPGPVEAGLEFESTIRIERSEAPEEVEGAGVPPRVPDRGIPEDWLALALASPDGSYRVEHDRNWHVFSEDDRQVVLRWVDAGTVVAQANLVAGPSVEPGARPKAERFRDDVRKALGEKFDRMIDAGEVAAPDGEFRYRLALAGKQGSEPIVWYYYLLSDPNGRQMVAIFTLRASEVGRFGRRDQRMIGSFRWGPSLP